MFSGIEDAKARYVLRGSRVATLIIELAVPNYKQAGLWTTSDGSQIDAHHEVTTLSAADFARFMDLLDAPPPPNDALARAADRHRALLGEPAP